jgi:hypothetical protein
MQTRSRTVAATVTQITEVLKVNKVSSGRIRKTAKRAIASISISDTPAAENHHPLEVRSPPPGSPSVLRPNKLTPFPFRSKKIDTKLRNLGLPSHPFKAHSLRPARTDLFMCPTMNCTTPFCHKPRNISFLWTHGSKTF